MPFEIISDSAGVIRIRLTGVLTRLDSDHAQSAIVEAIERHGKIKVMLILEDFDGWQSGVDWSDVSFADTHDDQIAKIAVVGDAQWKDDVLTFMTAPLRSTQIEYFEPAKVEEANRWLT